MIQGFKDGVEFVAMIDVGGLPITLCVPEDDVKGLWGMLVWAIGNDPEIVNCSRGGCTVCSYCILC